mmetsp:Transcript_20773/g.30411  ORF Transcript_20773/g.30411 Transcript_20773/m.30411 type:complete len:114 (+) Transcript_20773:902-1243(+)
MGMNVISPEARNCIWRELIVNKKGLKTFIDREGFSEDSYSFSYEHLAEMLVELDRLIYKYDNFPWDAKPTAQALVNILKEHRSLISSELAAGSYRKMKTRSSSTVPERFEGIE